MYVTNHWPAGESGRARQRDGPSSEIESYVYECVARWLVVYRVWLPLRVAVVAWVGDSVCQKCALPGGTCRVAATCAVSGSAVIEGASRVELRGARCPPDVW